MNKIQEFAERIKALLDGDLTPRKKTMVYSMIDELAGIASAPQIVHGADEFPAGNGEGFSDDVLIDLDGWRKHFAIGWYDHDDKEWRFHQEDRSQFEPANMKWTYLPLEKYDKK